MEPFFRESDDPGHRGLREFENNHSIRSGCLRRISVQVPIFLKKGKDLDCKCLIFAVFALRAMLKKATCQIEIRIMEGFLGNLPECVSANQNVAVVGDEHRPCDFWN